MSDAATSRACMRAQRMCMAQMNVEPVEVSTSKWRVTWYQRRAYVGSSRSAKLRKGWPGVAATIAFVKPMFGVYGRSNV